MKGIMLIELIKLKYRAWRYKHKKDKGGIRYVLSEISTGQTVMDIGSHKAGYLYYIRKKTGKTGKVYAFEPQSKLYAYLSMLKKLLRWDNVTIEKKALSDQQGQSPLFIPANEIRKGTSPGATILRKELEEDFRKTEEVDVETLDSYCEQRSIKPDFLKIDVEGNELNVLKGGIKTIQTNQPKILVEIEVRHAGLEKMNHTFNFLLSLGYSGHFIHGDSREPLKNFSIEKYHNRDKMQDYCNNFTFEPA